MVLEHAAAGIVGVEIAGAFEDCRGGLLALL